MTRLLEDWRRGDEAAFDELLPLANWISRFLSTYHGFDPQVEGARAVAWFWGLMTAGCLLGLLLLKLLDARRVLIGFAAAAIAALTAALFGGAQVSRLPAKSVVPSQ